MATVDLLHIGKAFGGSEVLHDITLQINEGEFVVVVGPSGCGKSTLLRLLAGLEEIDQGRLLIDGQWMNDRLPSERGVAMVFQSYALYPHMTVYDNMAFGLKISGNGKQQIRERVHLAAEILQIDALLHRKPAQLSGGQRQRVAIGRAIVRQPKLFLFDEPLSNLDARLRVQMRHELARLHRRLENTIIYVTHDQIEAMTLADRIVVLNHGCIEQIGTPMELYRRPANMFVAGFIGAPAMNFFNVTVQQTDGQAAVLQFADNSTVRTDIDTAALHSGDPLILGVRPEHIGIDREHDGLTDGLTGTLDYIEHLGEDSFLYLSLGDGGQCVVRSDAGHTYDNGQSLALRFHAGHCHVFRPDGVRLA